MDALTKSIAPLTFLWNRFINALTTAPSLSDWELTMGCLAIYGLLAILIGFPSQFLSWNTSAKNRVQLALLAFFAPALIEEIAFRILISPHPSEEATPEICWFWGGFSLFLFIIYHPLNALTFYRQGYPTFLNPIFLTLAALLGLVCTLVYGFTGSLWPPVLIHWVAVVIWLCWLGGIERLAPQEVSTLDE